MVLIDYTAKQKKTLPNPMKLVHCIKATPCCKSSIVLWLLVCTKRKKKKIKQRIEKKKKLFAFPNKLISISTLYVLVSNYLLVIKLLLVHKETI